ncbi:glycosyltransferase family 2 protein [bacterium]|nr:glycosyltransferase family 2 protein [bacterium]
MNASIETIAQLSVIVIAGREEDNIADCLASVRFADEIIVVCSSREDATMDIASRYTKHVHFRDFDGYATQKQFALDQATRDWVLSLDADERVTPELHREITAIVRNDGPMDGYTVPRKNHFRDKWLRHGGWYPDRQLRLFRRTHSRLTDRLVHEGFEVRGSRGELEGPLLHYTLPHVRHMLQKNLAYSLYEAREKRNRRRVGALDFLLRPPLEFAKKYILQRGFLDGWEGFVVAAIHAQNKMQVLLQLWEMQYRDSEAKR